VPIKDKQELKLLLIDAINETTEFLKKLRVNLDEIRQTKDILLNFEAVDWETTVWVNGQKVGTHHGGYDPFSFKITDALKKEGTQELVLAVWDPTDIGKQPRGKQVRQPRGIWYTAVTGIWRTVWLEPVNPKHIHSFRIVPDVDAELVRVKVDSKGETSGYTVIAEAAEGDVLVASGQGQLGEELEVSVRNPTLWSPGAPFLYDLKLKLVDDSGKSIDEVRSYFGMRKISVAKDKEGINRLFLNNQPLFHFGPLDQGWWPDGLYTAASDEALRYDVEVTRELGFNALRKHVKVEPRRFYYWCDKLGVMVWQDMPSGDSYIGRQDLDLDRSAGSEAQFMAELRAMIDSLFNHPSIVMWVPFNEGWGQFKTEYVTDFIAHHDPTRLVNNTSGWKDQGVGDVHDIHSYPGPAAPPNEEHRVAVLGEFGGLGLPIADHTWQAEKNWGYRNLKNPEELTRDYRALLDKLKEMIQAGLGAAIYTQTSDVEIEVNGLMTYDRAIIKMDQAQVVPANQAVSRSLKDRP
jgi:beta-galactosidase/beta-glucuronidase